MIALYVRARWRTLGAFAISIAAAVYVSGYVYPTYGQTSAIGTIAGLVGFVGTAILCGTAYRADLRSDHQ
jgi:hypothetical protein